MLVLVLGALTAIVHLAMPLIVAAIAPGFVRDAGKFDLTVELFRGDVPLPHLHVAGRDGERHAERAAALRRGGGRAGLLEHRLIGALGIGIWTGADGPTVARLLSWAVLIGGAAQLVMVVGRGADDRRAHGSGVRVSRRG